MDLALNNLRRLICHKIQSTNQPTNQPYVKAKIDDVLWNSKSALSGDRNENVSHIMIEYSKRSVKEFKSKHDLDGKMIHREISKRFQSDHFFICTNQNLRWKIKPLKFLGTF